MAFEAKALEIMIVSPSDVIEERDAVRSEIVEWNTVHARHDGAVLLPLGWDTHASPELSGRPQQIINERLLKHADLLVGIFWTRVGSPTGKAISGSIEEIEEHMHAGKPVMLYFSKRPIAPGYDNGQYQQLQVFRDWARKQGLIEEFDSLADFAAKFRRQLALTLRDNPYIRGVLHHSSKPVEQGEDQSDLPRLSADELELLKAAVGDEYPSIHIIDAIGAARVQAGQQLFGDGSARQFARWKAAAQSLSFKGFTEAGDAGRTYFEVTDAGYRVAEEVQ